MPTIQQAITNLLTTYEPEFLRFGYNLFLSFATILIVWQGIRMMFSHDWLGDQMFEFAKLLLFISFGYALIAFYESPIPGIGVSFSNLITDQAAYFQNILEARAFDNIYHHFDELSEHFVQPDAWSILANLIYWTVLLSSRLAKALSLAVIAFGLIASAVCGLLGPIFVPFFIVPKLDWLFWGWLKAFIQYSFIPVIAIAFLMIFERFVFQYLTTLPPTITRRSTASTAFRRLPSSPRSASAYAGAVADEVDFLRVERRRACSPIASRAHASVGTEEAMPTSTVAHDTTGDLDLEDGTHLQACCDCCCSRIGVATLLRLRDWLDLDRRGICSACMCSADRRIAK